LPGKVAGINAFNKIAVKINGIQLHRLKRDDERRR